VPRPTAPRSAALAATAFAAAALATRFGPAIADGDRTRDALVARDCAELGLCALRAAPTTIPGVWQGGLWTGLLATAHAAQVAPPIAQALVLGAEALAVGLVAHAVARRAGIAAGVVAAAALAIAILPLESARAFWNPSLLVLPSALAAVAATDLAAGGPVALAAAAGLGVGLAAAAHPVGLLAAPAVLVAAAGSRRPGVALAAATSAAALPLALTARAAIAVDVAMHGGPIAALVAAGAGVALLVAVGPRLARALPREADAIAPTLVTLAFAAACVLALAAEGHGLRLDYLAPAAPALALALGLGVARAPAPTRAAVAAGLAIALGAALAIAPRDHDAGYLLRDAPALGAALLRPDARWGELRFGLEGPRCLGAALALATIAPAPNGEPPAPTRATLLLRLPAIEADRARAAGLELVPLPGDAIAAVRPLASALDRDHAEACFVGGRGEPGCEPLLPAASEHVGRARFLFARRAYPEAWLHHHGGTFDLELAYPLRPRASAVRVDLAEAPRGRCPFRIGRVEGAALAASAEASVTILPGDGGRLVLARHVLEGDCDDARDDHAPPCLVESAPGDEALRALVEAAR
jgi:hypothetical protein